MQMVKNTLLALFVSWLAIIIFMPKQALYYKMEKTLATQEVVLNETSIEEGLFSLTLHQVSVYVKGIPVATVEEVKFFTLLFFSRLTVDKLLLDDSLKKMLPTEMNHAEITHSLVSPLNLAVHAQGSFGALEGNIDLRASRVRLDFNESKNIKVLKSELKKDEKGWYYETSF